MGCLVIQQEKIDTAPYEVIPIFFFVLLRSKQNEPLWILHDDEFIIDWRIVWALFGSFPNFGALNYENEIIYVIILLLSKGHEQNSNRFSEQIIGY